MLVAAFFLPQPLNAQLGGRFPKLSDLTKLQRAIVARICLNQVISIPPEQRDPISPAKEEEVIQCMFNYREVFSKDQLAIVRQLIIKTLHPQ